MKDREGRIEAVTFYVYEKYCRPGSLPHTHTQCILGKRHSLALCNGNSMGRVVKSRDRKARLPAASAGPFVG